MRLMVITALVGGLLVGATACSSGDEEPAAVVEPMSPMVTDTPRTPGVSGNDEIAAEDRAGFVAALREINPGLASNEERAVRRGRDVCLDIGQGWKDKGAEFADRVAMRFTGGSAEVDADQAGKIIAAAEQWICR